MKKLLIFLVVSAVALLTMSVANAATIFLTTLAGTNEVPPNASPAFGFGTVVLNDAQTQITVDENWLNLTAPATASR